MLIVHPKVADVLRQAGWFPERRVPYSQWADYFIARGFVLSPPAQAALENLGGLTVVPPTSDSNIINPSEMHFDPYYAASSEIDRLQGWEQDYNVQLFPIGEVGHRVILMCGEDGKIYGGGAGPLKLIGNSISEALETLILAERRWIPLS